MPRNRNHTSLNHNFDFSSAALQTFPLPEKVIAVNKNQRNVSSPNLQLPFCETIVESSLEKLLLSSSSSECDNVSYSEIISFGKSSSSSTSWGDEFDTDATQRVQAEFERMERILQEKEAIPPHYNQDEYKLWIKTFPQLSVSGNHINVPKKNKCDRDLRHTDKEEIFALDSDCINKGMGDKSSTSTELEIMNKIKKSVIDQVFESIALKVLNNNIVEAKTGHLEQLDNRRTHLVKNVESALTISPVLLNRHPSSSQSSLFRSEKLASKWLQEEPLEYSSLPYLSTASAKNKSLKSIGRKNSTSGKSRYSTKSSSHRNVVLPPIEKSGVSLANQYRSISATPRKPVKKSSAASVQVVDGTQAKFHMSRFLIQNDNLGTKKKL